MTTYKCRACGMPTMSTHKCRDAFCGAVADRVRAECGMISGTEHSVATMANGCLHTEVVMGNHVGHDVDAEGSSEQYAEHCCNCDAWRFATEVSYWDGRSEWYRGKWHDAADAPLEVRM